MSAFAHELSKLVLGALVVVAMIFGIRSSAPSIVSLNASRPEIYLITSRRVSYTDYDCWRVEYTIDGQAQAVDIPLKQDPAAFLAYLGKVGIVTAPGPEKAPF